MKEGLSSAQQRLLDVQQRLTAKINDVQQCFGKGMMDLKTTVNNVDKTLYKVEKVNWGILKAPNSTKISCGDVGNLEGDVQNLGLMLQGNIDLKRSQVAHSVVFVASPSHTNHIRADVTGVFFCNVRRIWAHEISIFVSRARDVAHPDSTSTQPLLRICSGWLTFAHPNYHFRQAAPQHAE
jgi:hypothetical protein